MEIVSSEGVERREGRAGMYDGEETVMAGIHGDSEDGGFGGESCIGDESFDDASVGDGGDDSLTERSEEEMLSAWVPREGFRVEVE